MSSNAGIAPGHAVTSAPNPPAPFVPGDALFNVVTTAVPYQALVGDFVLTTGSSVTTPVAPAAGEYFAVKNVGALTVTIVGTVDGAAGFTIPPSATPAAQEAIWFVWNATGATWQVVSGYDRLLPLSVDSVAGVAYDFALTDANVRLKSFTNIAAKAVTVLNEATVGWKAGTVLRGLNFGTGGVAGTLTVVAGAGVTIQRPKTFIGSIYAQFQLTYLGADVWVLSGEPLFTCVPVAAPYQAKAGELVLTTSTAVTTPVGPVDGDYFAVKNVGSNSVTITGSVDGGAYVLTPSTLTGAQHSVWFVWNAASATWRIVAEYNPVGPYHWTWADATARTAQVVTAADVGFIGYQTDLQQQFQLLGTGPSRWGLVPDPASGPYRACVAQNANVSLNFLSWQMAVNTGIATARTATQGNAGTQLTRLGSVTAAGAGSVSQMRGAGGCSMLIWSGALIRLQFTLGAVSPNMRWYAGISAVVGAANINPNTLTDCLGIGRDNQANVQFYHNDAAGLATTIDLGAAFPAVTVDSAYELILHTVDATSWGWNVRNMNTGVEISGIAAANIPNSAASIIGPMFLVSNNTDAVSVAQDFGSFEIWQRTR